MEFEVVDSLLCWVVDTPPSPGMEPGGCLW